MIRLRVLTLAACVAAFGVLSSSAQETDLKAILRKSIEAHGGAEKLTTFKAATSKFKGTMDILNMKLNITGETTLLKPDKLKNTMALEIMGKTINIVQVYNGKKLWISTMGETKEIEDEKILKEMRESLQVEGAAGLVEFLEKPFELSAIGEVKVKDKAAFGIRVSKKGQRDFSLFFDKQTHLLVKTEMRSFDAMKGEEITQEKFISEYRVVNGLKTAGRVVIHKDGQHFMDIEVTETKTFEKLDESNFAMP